MEETIVSVEIPYAVEFKRRRRRKIEGAILWDDGDIAIRTVTAKEAPVAYEMAPGDDGYGLEFDVRSFDGKLWWPLLDSSFPVSKKHFVGSATNNGSYFLSMMNLSPASIDSPRQTTEQFDNDMSINRIQSSSREERWVLANRAASHTLFCDDVVYVEGGPPAFFGISYSAESGPTLMLEIGSLRPQTANIFARWLPGPAMHRRIEAACRSLVFRIEDIDEEIAALRRKGFRLQIRARAAVCHKVESTVDPSEVFVDGLVRRALGCMDHDTARRLREAMNDRPLPAANDLMDRSICRDALHTMASMCQPENLRKRFGFEFEWLANALDRLDERFPPTLSSEDEDALLSLCLSPATLRAG